jgi:DNA-binding transcriptional LysR family regulator
MKDSGLVARRQAPCRTVVCAAPTYLAKHGKPQSIADLKAQNCLGYSLPGTIGTDRWPFGCSGKMSVIVRGTLKANNGDAVVAAASARQGIVYLPTFLVSRSEPDYWCA